MSTRKYQLWTWQEIRFVIERWRNGERDYAAIARALPGRSAKDVGKELRRQGCYIYRTRLERLK